VRQARIHRPTGESERDAGGLLEIVSRPALFLAPVAGSFFLIGGPATAIVAIVVASLAALAVALLTAGTDVRSAFR
jgi:hypothetical protein